MEAFRALFAATVAASVSGAASAALVYGTAAETGSRFNPGNGETITFMNCFVDTATGNQLALDNVGVGIRRIAAAGALTAVGVEVYAATMTYDVTAQTFGAGSFTSLGQFELSSVGAASLTQVVNASGGGSLLDLETLSNPGLGGFWIGVRFFGVNSASTANGWRVVNAPTVGASINGFAMSNYNASGAFQSFFAFGTPPGASPSRMMVDVSGTMVPAPGALALLGLAGALGTRQRR